MWGCISYTILLSAFWVLAIEYGTGEFRFFAVGLIVVWFALFSGFWFMLLQQTNYQGRLSQIIITVSYFLGIHYCILFPFFTKMQGYPFVFPLIPLIRTDMLFLLSYVGSTFLLICLVAFQSYAAQADKRALLFLIPFLMSYFMSKPEEGEWKKDFIVCGKQWIKKEPYERAQEICQHLISVKFKNPNKKIFILPETTFPFDLSEHQYALKMWTENVLYNDTYLILGVYRRKNNKLFNSFCLIHKGRIIFSYDKSHLIPFFEQSHSFNMLFKKGNSLFLNKKESFMVGSLCNKKMIFENLPPLTPLICSEAFWCMPKNIKAIALINDSYFSLKYFRNNMKLLFDFNSLEQSCDNIYCSYEI